MARGGDDAQAETLEIVEGIVEGVDFELAAVAGAGVDLTDREAAAEPFARGTVDTPRELGQRRVVLSRCRLGERRSQQALEQDAAHEAILARGRARNRSS